MENNYQPGSLGYDLIAAKNEIEEITKSTVFSSEYKEHRTEQLKADIAKLNREIAARDKMLDQSLPRP